MALSESVSLNTSTLSSLHNFLQSNHTIYPPDTQCWNNLTSFVEDRDPPYISFKTTSRICAQDLHVNVTQPMVDYLNLTKDINYYLQAYCLNPKSDDSCPFNYCSQSDVAGILVRVSTYIATLLLAILVFYAEEPQAITEAYWSQVLTLYSIMVAAVISIVQTQLTKFHAIIAIELVASPLTFYMAIYAVRSMFGHNHRLDHLLGRGKHHYRGLALSTVFLLISFFIYVMRPAHLQQFSQASCDAKSILVKLSFLLPVIFFAAVFEENGPVVGAVVFLPFALVAFSWVTDVYLRRHQLWFRSGRRKNPSFWDVWSTVGRDFPFVHFTAIYLMPYVLWVLTVEISLMNSNDQSLELSFGQILAMFVTVPPLMSVGKMAPRFWRWFVDLAWVRFVTGRPQKPSIPVMGVNHSAIPFSVSNNDNPEDYMVQESLSTYTMEGKDHDGLGTYQAVSIR